MKLSVYMASLVKITVVSPCVCVCVPPIRRVSRSQLTPSRKLVHHSTKQLGGYGRGAIQGAQSEMALDTHLCFPVVSERTSSVRENCYSGFT